MTERNADRPGYKKTPTGGGPKERECQTGQEITHTTSNVAFIPTKGALGREQEGTMSGWQ